MRGRGVVLALAPLSACGGRGQEAAHVAAADEPSGTDVTTEPALDADDVVSADEIPVAHTPPGGYGDHPPGPVLAGCTEPLVAGAPDLRGLWRAVEVTVGGTVVDQHPLLGQVQRIEQCGDRLVVTAGGVVHDMRVDGTEANGVHDVAQADFTTPLDVVATYEDGVHVLRPVGLPVEVTRRLDGEQLVWDYVGFTARLDRIGGPDDPFPSEEGDDG